MTILIAGLQIPMDRKVFAKRVRLFLALLFKGERGEKDVESEANEKKHILQRLLDSPGI